MSSDRDLRLERDHEARRLAQSEFGRPLMVVAGAGTGKTSLLVTRAVAWLVGEGWRRHEEAGRGPDEVARRVVERVVAITFTEAAAAEMAERVVGALEALSRSESPVGWLEAEGTAPRDETAGRARRLLDEVHRLRVQTIHAFCQALLAEHPLEAGLHPRLEVDADLSRVEAMVDELVEGALRSLAAAGAGDEDWRRLAERGLGPAEVADGLRALVAAGVDPADLAGDPFAPEAAAAIGDRLRAAVAAFESAGGGPLERVKARRTASAAGALLALGRALEGLAPATFDGLAALAAEVDRGDLSRLQDWARGRFNQTERCRIRDTAAELAAAAAAAHSELRGLCGLDREGHLAARRTLAPLLSEVRRAMAVRGLLTYDDLLTGAARLLQVEPSVRRRLRASIDQLLVDEFQDTDAVQCRIVDGLALGDGPRPGLFVVGDPKQSIYGFRRADLAAYDDFRDRLAAAGGEELVLGRNFRSVQPILDEVERVVAPVMGEARGLQPAFEPLEATEERARSSGFDHPPWTAVEHWVCWPAEGGGPPAPPGRGLEAALRLEAETVARDLVRLHEEAAMPWGDAALLLRSTTRQ
ncbi:MAG TPA: UvrD-helicase domain-containing protein, partial [Thermoanaerobaculia bacterium]|nr:UvrD-helicase domain-containing protein [Thermoanaerobaculia bacterium]